MVAATSIEPLESRVARLEEALRAVERRIADIDGRPRAVSEAHAIDPPPANAPFDFALIGKSVLIVGGAYLLRALTEMGLLPQGAGAVLAFVYAMVWIGLADRALARGRRTAALSDAATAVLIAGSLIWEATTRFHFFAPAVASMLSAIATLALLAVAVHRQHRGIAFLAAATMTFTSIGLAIGTGDVVPPLLAVAITGVVALRTQSPVTLIFAIASDFLALALTAMAVLDRAPRSLAAIALGSVAVLWVFAIETRPRWPESIQTAAALLIGAGGASLLMFDARSLAILWSVRAVIVAAIGRRWQRFQWALQAPFWAMAATIAAFTLESRTIALSIAGALAIVALSPLPTDAPLSRLTLLGIATLIALACSDMLLPAGNASVLAMERSVILALAAIALSLLGHLRAEAAILARVVLAVAGIKFLIEDFRAGHATTIVVALAAYGIAIVLVARRRTPHSLMKENA
jgi:hypothetical protein